MNDVLERTPIVLQVVGRMLESCREGFVAQGAWGGRGCTGMCSSALRSVQEIEALACIRSGSNGVSNCLASSIEVLASHDRQCVSGRMTMLRFSWSGL